MKKHDYSLCLNLCQFCGIFFLFINSVYPQNREFNLNISKDFYQQSLIRHCINFPWKGVINKDRYLDLMSDSRIKPLIISERHKNRWIWDNDYRALDSPDYLTDNSDYKFDFKPDLSPIIISLNNDNFIQVTVKNKGLADMPELFGSLSIYLDEEPLGTYDFTLFSNPKFLSAGGSEVITTQFKIYGEKRRVAAIIGVQGFEHLDNPHNNYLTANLDPVEKQGFDIKIKELEINENVFNVIIQNMGNITSPENQDALLHVIINDSVVFSQYIPVPVLDPGFPWETEAISLDLDYVPVHGDKIKVFFETLLLPGELDFTNTRWIETYIDEDSNWFETYQSECFDSDQIRENIVWQHGNALKPYAEWEDEWKADLKDVLFNIERGKPIRMINPPVLGFGNSLYPDDAWQIYLAHLGHSLWLEAHGVLPWSLKDMEPEHLKYLLSSEYMMKYDAITISGVLNKCYLIKCKDGKEGITAAVWDPWITYYFMVNDILRDGNYTKGKLLHNTQEDTIYALADWLRAYSQHNLPNQSNKSLYDYNKSAIDRILYPIEGKKCTIITCSGVTAVFRAVLRTVNIPVSSLTIDLVGDAHSDGGTHSTPGFPSIGKQLLNGDDIFDYTLKPTGNTNPVSTLFFSDIQMQDLFENPELDCLEEKCHTIIAQRSYNHAKYLRSLAYNYQVDGILYYYVNYGEDYLDKFLAGPYDIETNKVNNELYLLPYFSKEERKIMIDNTKSWVLQLGEGDFQKGKERIKDRFYHNN